MKNPQLPLLLTNKELCQQLKVTERTLFKYRTKHGLPHLVLPGHVYRYSSDAVMEWIKSLDIPNSKRRTTPTSHKPNKNCQ
jgi:excisionase family DNA binding protein